MKNRVIAIVVIVAAIVCILLVVWMMDARAC
jgi:hypothetical protein